VPGYSIHYFSKIINKKRENIYVGTTSGREKKISTFFFIEILGNPELYYN
jgi:hypothetical protein